jgi:hypothetical protein
LLGQGSSESCKAISRLKRPVRKFTFEGCDDIDCAAIDDLPGDDHASVILEKIPCVGMENTVRVLRFMNGQLGEWAIYAHLKPYVAVPPTYDVLESLHEYMW